MSGQKIARQQRTSFRGLMQQRATPREPVALFRKDGVFPPGAPILRNARLSSAG
jgi:hypothetical protein